MTKWNVGLAIVLIALSILIFVSTAPYHRAHGNDPGPAFWPRTMAVALSVLSVLMVIEGIVKERKEKSADPIGLASPEMRRIYWMILIFAVFAVVLYYGGFIIASLLFIPAVMRLLGEKKWLKCILVSVIVSGTIYFFFSVLLRVTLPQPFFLS